MKILAVLFALAFLATPSQAETWNKIHDDIASGKMLIDIDSLHRYTYKNDPTHTYVKANFKVEGAETTPVPDWTFWAFIDFDSCVKNTNGLLRFKAEMDTHIADFFWKKDGTKFYDLMGDSVCALTKNNLAMAQEAGDQNAPVRF